MFVLRRIFRCSCACHCLEPLFPGGQQHLCAGGLSLFSCGGLRGVVLWSPRGLCCFAGRIGCEIEVHVQVVCPVSGWALVTGTVPGRVVGFSLCLMELRAFGEGGPGSLVVCFRSDQVHVRGRWPCVLVASLGWVDSSRLSLGRLVCFWLHNWRSGRDPVTMVISWWLWSDLAVTMVSGPPFRRRCLAGWVGLWWCWTFWSGVARAEVPPRRRGSKSEGWILIH